MFTRESSHQIKGRYCPRALKSNASRSNPCATASQSFALNGSGLLGMSSTRPIDNCFVGSAFETQVIANKMKKAILIVACQSLHRVIATPSQSLHRHHRRQHLGFVQARGHDVRVAAAVDD